MKILITGGTGFIGAHLINELVQRYPQARFEVVDNLTNSRLTPERKKFFNANSIIFHKKSVEDFSPSSDKYNQIYHLASPVGPAGVLKYAGRMGIMILSDALKMAKLALRDNARLLLISTSEVYGYHPKEGEYQHEDVHKIVPSKYTVRLEYGVGKLLEEIAILNLAKVEPLRVNFIRPFNIVGPYQNGEAGFVLPRFVDAALAGKSLTVFGDGEQKRTFTHVSDIVKAMLMIMNSDLTGKIYNVGNPQNICSVKELARKVVALSGSKSEILFVDPKKIYGELYEEAWNKIPDISKITADLNWRPRYSLDGIVNEYINFARQNKDDLIFKGESSVIV